MASPASFHTTRWSQIALARTPSDEGLAALTALCDAYYEPVTAFLRVELRDADLARDLAHAFFAELLQGGRVDHADAARGRFRSYLLGAVKHFLSHHREAALRQKRGGGADQTTLDGEEARELPDARQEHPDAAFDREWALTVLALAMECLQSRFAELGKAADFELLRPWLVGEPVHGEQHELAAALNIPAGSLKSRIHRLKAEYRELVKEEIAVTLHEGGSVDEEMKALMAALRKS